MAANPIAVSIYDGREAFYQWDLNQRIVLAGVGAGQEVHFENSSVAECPVVETYELDGCIVADMPNEMLQYPEHIRAHIYIEDDAGISITQFSAILRVLSRKKPSDYIHTPTEVKRWEALEQRIEALERGIVPDSSQNANGLSTEAANLLIEILETAVFTANNTGKIASLKEALASGGSSGGDTGSDTGAETPDEPDVPTVSDDITVSDGAMTIVAVGSAIAVSDDVMTIA